MTSHDRQIAQIEQSIEQSKADLALGNALARLFENRDFKKVVLDGYFKDEAIRLVHLLVDPNMQDAEKQNAILSEMRGIGSLRSYFHLLEHKSAMAIKSIPYSEETLAELTAAEGGENV